ncbi:15882_t:CDS:2, partial [Funneliformis geosporum]
QAWLDAFLASSVGYPNKKFINIHQEFELAAFSCSPVEKKLYVNMFLFSKYNEG